jgi:hypothetical protein
MAKVYVVTSGSYSDYGIASVFDSRELAEAMVRGREDYRVEEYTLNPGQAEYHAGRTLWQVEMLRDGNVPKPPLDLGFAWEDVEEDSVQMLTQWVGFELIAIGVALQARVWASTPEQAVKATNERRAQWIADGRWDHRESELMSREWKWAPGELRRAKK